jgi:hypothetical protein
MEESTRIYNSIKQAFDYVDESFNIDYEKRLILKKRSRA